MLLDLPGLTSSSHEASLELSSELVVSTFLVMNI